MSSVFNGSSKQNANDIGYYINIGDMRGKISAYNATAGQPTFSTATWAFGTPALLSTALVQPGNIFKDMGRTVVSSNRTFRKVQLVVSTPAFSTNGVGGKTGTTPNEDYFTGYIELGFDGTGPPAPVAHFGR